MAPSEDSRGNELSETFKATLRPDASIFPKEERDAADLLVSDSQAKPIDVGSVAENGSTSLPRNANKILRHTGVNTQDKILVKSYEVWHHLLDIIGGDQPMRSTGLLIQTSVIL